MLRTNCIYRPSHQETDLRISVMSRHTLSDGRSPDPNIDTSSYDAHWVNLAPPPKLIGAYYRGELDWNGFESRFSEHFMSVKVQRAAEKLIELSLTNNTEIVCVEPAPDFCHRRLVAEFCLNLNPELEINLL